jgi:hypothetical protein
MSIETSKNTVTGRQKRMEQANFIKSMDAAKPWRKSAGLQITIVLDRP